MDGSGKNTGKSKQSTHAYADEEINAPVNNYGTHATGGYSNGFGGGGYTGGSFPTGGYGKGFGGGKQEGPFPSKKNGKEDVFAMNLIRKSITNLGLETGITSSDKEAGESHELDDEESEHAFLGTKHGGAKDFRRDARDAKIGQHDKKMWQTKVVNQLMALKNNNVTLAQIQLVANRLARQYQEKSGSGDIPMDLRPVILTMNT